MVENQDLSQEFKIAMRKYAYSVSIVSNTSNKGINNAITISSFTSISVDPPSILMCINKSSSIHKTLLIDSSFCVNLLNEKQKEAKFGKKAMKKVGNKGENLILCFVQVSYGGVDNVG